MTNEQAKALWFKLNAANYKQTSLETTKEPVAAMLDSARTNADDTARESGWKGDTRDWDEYYLMAIGSLASTVDSCRQEYGEARTRRAIAWFAKHGWTY